MFTAAFWEEKMADKWVTMWGNSMSCDKFSPSNYAKNITLRYIFKSTIIGKKVRIKFSNSYGYENVKLTAVTIGKVNASDMVSEIKKVTFSGNCAAVINKGDILYSDEIDFAVNSGNSIAISIYIENYTDMHSAIKIIGPNTKCQFAEGDFSSTPILDPMSADETDTIYFLDSVEVLSDAENKALIVFGDSISAQSWPDYLIQRLIDEKRNNIAVVRKAVSGSRVLREYNNLALIRYAHAGIKRFEADICSVKGADRVIVFHGINDIIHPCDGKMFRPLTDLPTAEQLIDGYKYYIQTAHKHGLKIYISTITPFIGCGDQVVDRDVLRRQVNEWIKTNTMADGYIDFALAISNPLKMDRLLEKYDCGDHLHPSFEGGKALAQCVPNDFLS